MIDHVLPRVHGPVTRRQDVEFELLDPPQRVHPIGVVRIGEGAEGQAPDRYEINREQRGGIGDDLAAGAAVGVVVAEDEVLDRPIEPLVDLGFELGDRLRVDGVGGNQPLRRHQEDGEVEVFLKAVKVACDVGDDAFGLSVKRAEHEHDCGEARGGSDPRYEWFHRSLHL